MDALLVTGTDTEVGKTIVTAALAAYWQRYYTPYLLGIMKPIQSGVGDREFYQRVLTLSQSLDEITPLYFQAPLAPPLAAEREGRSVDLAVIWQAFLRLKSRSDWLLVEALGGLGSPITWELTVADLARDWRLPTLLVVPVRLGAIAQAVANVALARQARLDLRGIVLNCRQPDAEAAIADWAPPHLIQSLTQTRVLGHIPYLSDPADPDVLVQVAATLQLEVVLPPVPKDASVR